MTLKGAIKPILIILLLVANIYFIAWNSFTKYIQKGIVVEVSTEASNGLIAPAITICASHRATK